jgi:hypothetical protein
MWQVFPSIGQAVNRRGVLHRSVLGEMIGRTGILSRRRFLAPDFCVRDLPADSRNSPAQHLGGDFP